MDECVDEGESCENDNVLHHTYSHNWEHVSLYKTGDQQGNAENRYKI